MPGRTRLAGRHPVAEPKFAVEIDVPAILTVRLFGCEGRGGEARISAGRSGVHKDRNYYVFTNAALIHQEGGCDRQRIEFGYGSDLGGNFFTTQQLWLEYGSQPADSIKSEAKIGDHFPAADVSIG